MAYSYEKIKNLLSYAVALNPDGAFPLDARVYFGALGDATNPAEGTARYAAKNAKPAGSSESAYFFGQQLYVVENDKVTTYLIQTDGTLKEVGVTTKGDGNSIVTTTDDEGNTVLAIKGVSDSSTAGKSLVSDGAGGIYWSTTSQSDLDANLAEIESDIDDLENNIAEIQPVLTDLANKLANTGAVFNFAGFVTKTEFGNLDISQYQPGDVIIVDKDDEYVCVKDIKNGYILTEDETPVLGATYYIKTLDDSGKETYSVVEVSDDTNPKTSGYYVYKTDIEYLRWEGFGDPDGLVELEKRVKANEEAIAEISSEQKSPSAPADGSGLKEYIDQQDAATLAAARAYADQEVGKIVIPDWSEDIDDLEGRVAALESDMDQAQIDIAKNTKDIKHVYEEKAAVYTVTNDTEVADNKQYFIKDGNAYNVIVPEEGANPQALGYYELVSAPETTGVLADEIARAKAKENAIATDLTNEINRAKGAEAALEGAIAQATDDIGARIQPIEEDVQDLKDADIVINNRIDDIYKKHTTYDLTSDEAPASNKTYYTKDGEEYRVVENPSGNPKELGYYEIKTVASGALANEIKRSEEKDAQLANKLAELESDVGTIGNLGAANKAAIEKIYKETREEDGTTTTSGFLKDEIERATLAEEGLRQAITDETGRATAKENKLAGDIAALESTDAQHATAIKNNTKAIEAIYKFTPATYVSTSDESVAEGKTYYSQNDGAYIPVSNPTGNPKELGYFEISVVASETGELTKYELKTAAEAKLNAAKEYTNSAIAGVEGIIGELQTNIGKLKNVMNFVGSLIKEDDTKEEKETIYEITDITLIPKTEDINITSKKPFEKGDVGVWNQQEYVCIEPGTLIDGVYTSTWTAIGDVSAFSASINGLEDRKLDKEAYEKDTAELSKTIEDLQKKDAELESVIGEEIDRATGVEDGLNNRLTAVENSIEYIAYVSTNDTKVDVEKSYYQFVDNQYKKVTTFEENDNPKELGYFEIDSDSSGLRVRLNTAEKDIDVNTQAIISLQAEMESAIQDALTWGLF